jgi:tetratricopeptide (TPR) repeat protein
MVTATITPRSTGTSTETSDVAEVHRIRGLVAERMAIEALDCAVSAVSRLANTSEDTAIFRVAVAEAYLAVAHELSAGTGKGEPTRVSLYEQAIEHLKVAEARCESPFAELLMARGSAHAGLQDWSDAARSFKCAAQADPRESRGALQALFLLSFLQGDAEPSVRRIAAAQEQLLGHLLIDNVERAYLMAVDVLQGVLAEARQNPHELRVVDPWAVDLARISAYRFGKDRELAMLLVAMEDAGLLDPKDNGHHPLDFELSEPLRTELRD